MDGEERKYINLISCITVCEKSPRQFHYMTITAAETDGKGWKMVVDIRNNYLFDDEVIRPTKIGIVTPSEAAMSILKNIQIVIDMIEH